MEKIPKVGENKEYEAQQKSNPFEKTAQYLETSEARETFRGSLGFGFIFVTDQGGTKRCYCVEINGERTGIAGMGDIPKGEVNQSIKDVAQIRTHYNPAYRKKLRLANEVLGSLNASKVGKMKITEYINKSKAKDSLLTHSERNPKLIEKVALNKRLQHTYIPEGHRPREYRPRTDPESRTGYWIVKPASGQNGIGIFIFSNEEFIREVVENKDIDIDMFVIQEFIQADSADNADEEHNTSPASMRYLVDFRYLSDGSIEEVYKGAYQRVSRDPRHPLSELSIGDRSTVYIVNKTRGALSVPASDEEMRLAKELADQIIHNLAAEYQRDTVYTSKKL